MIDTSHPCHLILSSLYIKSHCAEADKLKPKLKPRSGVIYILENSLDNPLRAASVLRFLTFGGSGGINC